MLRPVSLLPALAAATLAGILVAPVAPSHASTAAHPAPHRADDAPLAVTIDSLTPSEIPPTGPVRVSGQVTNDSNETWQTINLYPFVSETPMTTAEELAAAPTIDAGQDVGPRITEPAPYYIIDELAPGESRSYSFAVPRRRIAAASPGVAAKTPGVYWFGVHALGQTDATRDTEADGRARTFLPLVTTTQRSVETALVVPVRNLVRHEADGRLADLAEWTRTLSTGGQLRSLADFGAVAGTRPLSWLLDPAVTDAAFQLSQGNPPRSLAPTIDDTEGEGEEGSESPSPTESGSPSGDPQASEGAEPTDPPDAATVEAAAAATDWLARLYTGLNGTEILSLPYGDLDLAAAAAHSPSTYQTARERSAGDLAPWGLPTVPAVSSPSGFLPSSALDLVEPDTRIVVTDRMVGGTATVSTTGGHEMVVASTGAAAGGPGPDDPLAPVAMRQRIVSEAAVRLLAPVPQPLVVVLPASAPPTTTGFFDGLDLEWLDLTTVDQVAQRPATPVPADQLAYPQAQRDAELEAVDFTTAGDLIRAGDTLQNLLTRNDQVGGEVRGEALANLAYATRAHPLRTRAAALRSRTWIDQRLGSVDIEAPKAVILSSGSGRFSVVITNSLDQPVTVQIKAATDPRLRVSVPATGIELAPGARTTILLNASSPAIGVRNVTLSLTDTEGAPLGSEDVLPIRSNRVSNVIWLILGTGIALLLGAIVVRLFRRIRAARRG